MRTTAFTAVELWFRVLHDTVTDDSYSIDRKDIWEAIKLSQLHFIDVEKMNDWFGD